MRYSSIFWALPGAHAPGKVHSPFKTISLQGRNRKSGRIFVLLGSLLLLECCYSLIIQGGRGGLCFFENCLVVTLSGILFILLDFLFCLVYWGLLCFWVTSMFCCYIMKRQKNKHLKFCGWLRMEQSNLFIWRGFFKDFRYVSRLDRQRKRLFEEASLSHGVIKHICVECFCCHCFFSFWNWQDGRSHFVIVLWGLCFALHVFFVYIEFETGC